MNSTRILIVDKNKEALQRYERDLSDKKGKWSVVTATSFAAAVRSSRETPPDIAIAAFDLGKTKGPKLLAEIEQIAPNSQRFIAATEEEKPKLEDTFGSSFQFLPNPCPKDRLLTEIQSAIAIDTWLGNERIKELTSRMGEFPSLPPIYLKVVNTLNSRNASAVAVAKAVSGDLAISAKVLQTVNSSYYGYEEKISDITQAVSILGTECVKNLVLAIQVFDKLGQSPDQKAITDELWHHSMSVAVAARRIAMYETSDEKAAEEAYTAGLMHDLGKLILLNAMPQHAMEARRKSSEENLPLWEAETELIGCHHAETGAYVIARWGMPTSIAEAAALHHEPVNSFGSAFSSLAAVHIANAIVHSRQKEDHPSAKPSEEFVSEIGGAESWEAWLAVSAGKTPPKKSAKSTKRPAKAGSDQQEEDEGLQPGPSQGASAPIAAPAPAKPSKALPLLAVAACIILSLCGIFLLNSFESGESIKEEGKRPFDPEASFSYRESGVDLSLQDSAALFKEAAETAIAESAESQPAPELSAIESATAELESAASQSPDIAQRESPNLPQPILPSLRDSFPKIALTGIFYSADRPLASINGQIRKEGDTVNGVRILSIEEKRIVVQHEQDTRSIKLD